MTDETLRALARAAAAGETECLVPMETVDVEKAAGAVRFGRTPHRLHPVFRDPDGKERMSVHWMLRPLTPGEVVEVPCQDATWGPVHHDLQPSGCGCLCHEGEWGDWPAAGCEYCYAYHQSCPTCGTLDGQLSVRILSFTPERGCETCKGRLSVPCDGPEPGESAVETCPTCHGEPPWRWWRVGFEEVTNG